MVAILLILGPLNVWTHINTIYDDYFDNRLEDLIKPDEKQTSETKVSEATLNENDIEKDEIEERYIGQVFKKTDGGDCLISIPEKARTINGKKELTYIITVNDCEFDTNQLVEVVYGALLANEETIQNSEGQPKSDIGTDASPESEGQPKSDIGTDASPESEGQPKSDIGTDASPENQSSTLASQILVKPISNMQTFESLSLTTTRANQDIILKYNDSSDKTLNVMVTLRNSNEEIFSGDFNSSKFEILVKDVSKDSPYIIEMVITHEILGKIFSSVYNPSGSDDNVINGIFTTD